MTEQIYKHTTLKKNLKMENYYKDSKTIIAIERASDLIQVGFSKINEAHTNFRKRSRESLDVDQVDEVFKEIYLQMEYYGVLPTFRTFVLSAFYILLSVNQQNKYYTQIMNCIVDFRRIISESDDLFFQNKIQDLYFKLVDDLITFLRHSQQFILLFHLSCENKVNY